MKYKILLLPFFFMATTLYCTEPSAFDAGNINLDTPYGLTDNEKYLLSINNKVNNLNKEVSLLKTNNDLSNEQIDGLRSVFEGFNSKIFKLEESIKHIEEKTTYNNESVQQLKQDFNDLKVYMQENRKIVEQNQIIIQKTLKEISKAIDTINSNYVSKSDFESFITKSNQTISSKSITDFSNKTNSQILQDGEALFAKKEYSKAKPYFEKTLSAKHKPARSNFVLGEIAYFSNKYSDAIAYYKASAELHNNAEWMPKLLYHTAISFDKIGDIKSANQFYLALKTTYPDSEEAKASPDRK